MLDWCLGHVLEWVDAYLPQGQGGNVYLQNWYTCQIKEKQGNGQDNTGTKGQH